MKTILTSFLLIILSTAYSQNSNDAVQATQGSATIDIINYSVTNLQTCNADIQLQYGSTDITVNVSAGATYLFQVSNQDQILKVRATTFCSAHDKNWITIQVFKAIPLPVKLLSFSANGNYLQWNVSGEVDFNLYEIEKSKDGKNYVSAGSVKATGATKYSFIDPYPYNSSITYYRLRMVDNNGSFAYSSIVSSRNNKPVIASVSIFDFSGRIVATAMQDDPQTIRNKVNGKPGIYIVSTKYADQNISTQKIAF